MLSLNTVSVTLMKKKKPLVKLKIYIFALNGRDSHLGPEYSQLALKL